MQARWRLLARVRVAAVALGVVVIAIFAVLLVALRQQSTAAERARDSSDVAALLTRLERFAVDLETGERGFVITEGRLEFLKPYTAARAQIPPVFSALARLRMAPAQRVRVGRLQSEMAAYESFLGRLVDRTSAREDDSEEVRLALAEEGRERLDTIRSQLGTLLAVEAATQRDRRAASAGARGLATIVAIAGLVVLLAAIVVAAIAGQRLIVAPIDRLVRFAAELRAGRLDARLPETGPPDAVDLARAFNEAAATIADAETRLQLVSERYLAELDASIAAAPLGFAFVDPDGVLLRRNANFALRLAPGGAVRGDVFDELEEIPAAIRAAVARVRGTGEAVLEEDVELSRPGEQRALVSSAFPVRSEDGTRLLAIGVVVADVTDRRRAEEGRERLQTVALSLAAAVELDEVVDVFVEQASRVVAASTAVLFLLDTEGEALEIAAVRNLADDVRDAWQRVPVSRHTPPTEALRLRRPQFLLDPVELAERFPETAAGLHAHEAVARAQLPLVVSGRALGVLSLVFPRSVDFDGAERDLLFAMATQGAQAISRAQLYEREHSVSRTLQDALLPRSLPEPAGLDVAARLQAGTAGVDVGGDFYDLFELPGGTWGAAIGDVCGKGVDAAAITGLARHTVRAAARADPTPESVLAALNEAVLAESRPGQFVTAIFLHLQRLDDGRFRVDVACGGHPPPVVLDAAGGEREVECSGTLLGVLDDPDLVPGRIDLDPGDTLLLYTDGLTEAGAPAYTMTTPEVATLLADARGTSAAATADSCLERVLAIGGGSPRDDVALLVLQVPDLAIRSTAQSGGSTAWRGARTESSTSGQ